MKLARKNFRGLGALEGVIIIAGLVLIFAFVFPKLLGNDINFLFSKEKKPTPSPVLDEKPASSVPPAPL